jgi:hypothetical protein
MATDPGKDQPQADKNGTSPLQMAAYAAITAMGGALVTGVFNKPGRWIDIVATGTALALVFFLIGVVAIELRRRYIDSMQDTHFRRWKEAEKLHDACLEENAKICQRMDLIEAEHAESDARWDAKFDLQERRHERETSVLRDICDKYEAGRQRLMNELHIASEHKPRNPDSDPKGSVLDGSQGGNPGRRG